MIKSLLSKGADIYQECGIPYNPSTPLSAWDISRRTKELYKKFSLSRVQPKKTLPIFKAVDYNNLESIKEHFDNGLSLKIKWYDGTLLQHHVARKGNLQIVKYFIKQGVNLNEKDKEGMDFLMHSIYGGNIETVRYLIEEKNMNLKTRDVDDMNLLMHAAYAGNIDLVKYLVEIAGVDTEEKSKQGKKAIDYTFSQKVRYYLKQHAK